jgi:hypothetical protein
MRNTCGIFAGKFEASENLGVDDRIMLKWLRIETGGCLL